MFLNAPFRPGDGADRCLLLKKSKMHARVLLAAACVAALDSAAAFMPVGAALRPAGAIRAAPRVSSAAPRLQSTC